MENHLLQIRKQLALKQNDLAGVLDCSPENISMIERGKSTLSERNKKCLIKKFNLNPAWFGDPKEPMFASEAPFTAGPATSPSAMAGAAVGVPMFDLDKTESLVELFAYVEKKWVARAKKGAKKAVRTRKDDEKFAPVGCIAIPSLTECSGAIRVSGEGMTPIINSGDIVIYNQLALPMGNFTGEIMWGEIYLVEIETAAGNYIAVRRMKRSSESGMAILSAVNPDFADTEIPLANIRALAIVKGTVRMHF